MGASRFGKISDLTLHRMADANRPRSGIFREARAVASLVRTIIQPARRHCCEICKFIFDCHLCSIGVDHRIHVHQDFICEICIEKHDLEYVLTKGGMDGGAVELYDHMTGKKIGRVYAIQKGDRDYYQRFKHAKGKCPKLKAS